MSSNQEEMSSASITNEDSDGSKVDERSGDVENMDSNNVTHSNSQDNGKSEEENKNSDQSKMQNIWRNEEDVGITEYLGTHDGFSAIIKQRYSDFHVNEVNAQGEVVHLTDETIIDPPQDKESVQQIVPEGAPACIPEEKIAEIKHMVEMNNKLTKDNEADEEEKAEKKPTEVLIKVDGLEKQDRTSIHQYIKTNYKKIVSSTREMNGEKFILVKTGGSADDRWDKKTPWPKSQRYTYFVLYKENLDTMDAVSQIAFKLRMKPAMFSYAGTKDKRGKTSQLVSVPELPPQRLYSVTQYNWSIMVGNFSFHHKPLKLGQLCGNRFKLVLRDISVSDEVVNNAVENLRNHGFINYYGMQRFGTTHVATHSIGKALLQGNWSEAVNLILTPRSKYGGDEYSMSNVLREYQKDGNAEEALHKLYDCYKGSSLEAQLLRGISECDKNDFVGALGRLPRNMRSLYLHAYQSLIWNRMASRRIKEFGFRVLPGDLVRQRTSASAKEMLPEDESEAVDAEDDSTLVDEVPQEEPAKDDTENKKNLDIHVLTAEEAKDTDITEILLPLPGHDILLPENEMKNWYIEMLEKDGLSLEKLKHKVKDYSVSGVYRRLLVRPSDVNHFITYYNDVSYSLVQSDKEKLKGEDVEENKLEGFPGLAEGNPIKPMDEDTETKENNQSTDENEKPERVDDDDNKDGSERDEDMKKGRMKALVLELTLPASCYATMALRELLKIDTSLQFNKTDSTNSGITSGRGRGGFDNRRGGFDNRRGGFDNRRGGFDNRRGGFGDRRGGFGDRRGGFGDRRGGFGDRRGGFGDRRGGHGDRRGGHGDRRGGFGEKRRGSYDGSRGSFDGERKRGRF